MFSSMSSYILFCLPFFCVCGLWWQWGERRRGRVGGWRQWGWEHLPWQHACMSLSQMSSCLGHCLGTSSLVSYLLSSIHFMSMRRERKHCTLHTHCTTSHHNMWVRWTVGLGSRRTHILTSPAFLFPQTIAGGEEREEEEEEGGYCIVCCLGVCLGDGDGFLLFPFCGAFLPHHPRTQLLHPDCLGVGEWRWCHSSPCLLYHACLPCQLFKTENRTRLISPHPYTMPNHTYLSNHSPISVSLPSPPSL